MHLLDKVLPVLDKPSFITLQNVSNIISHYFCKTINGKRTDGEFRVYDGKNRSDFSTNYKIKFHNNLLQ